MKIFTVFVLALAFLVIGCGNPQPETDPAINIPAGEIILDDTTATTNAPSLTRGINLANQNVCRANMQAASAAVTMYQAQNSELPASIEEVAFAVCPEAGSYNYTVNGSSWKVECPCEPSHGFVENGNASW